MNYVEVIKKYSWDWLAQELPDIQTNTDAHLPAYVDINYHINGLVAQELDSEDDKRLCYAYWYYKHNHKRMEKDPVLKAALKKLKDYLLLPYPKFDDVFWKGDHNEGIRLCNYHYAFWLALPEELRFDLTNPNFRFAYMVAFYTMMREGELFNQEDQVIFDYIISPPGYDLKHTRVLHYQYWVNLKNRSFDDMANDEIGTIKKILEEIDAPSRYLLEFEKQYVESISNTSNDEDLADTTTPKFSAPTLDGVNILGYPRSDLGLGEYARTSAEAINLQLKNTSLFDLGISQDTSKKYKTDSLVSKELRHNINIFNTPPTVIPIELLTKGRSLFNGKYNIGYLAWEFSTWKPQHNYCFDLVQEIWTISGFLKECFEKNTDKPVIHMPLPVTCEAFEKKSKSYFGLSEDKFCFLFTFDFNSKMKRKNPIATINAFQKAFPDNQDVNLIIKVMYTNEEDPEWISFLKLIEADKRIILINEVLTKTDLLALIECADAFISLHRSEGFGICIAEAMLLKTPCIVTDYSGSTDFSNTETAFLVDYTLVPVQKNEYIYAEGLEWADPNIETAALNLKKVFAGGDEVKKIIESAHLNIKNNFSISACSNRYIKRLKEIGLKIQ